MSDRLRVMELFEEQKDFLNDKIEHGIELYRKGYGYITLRDKEGNVVRGAKITARQKSHEFKFGANLFMLDEFETTEKNELYKHYFADVFNMATLPFYWDATEPEPRRTRYDKNSVPMYRRPPIDRCMEFCEEQGIEPREHALAYELFFPAWLYNSTVPEIKKALERRYKEISERYGDKIHTIEVTNEVMSTGGGRTAFYNQSDFVEWCFKLAEKYFPANQLGINEATSYVWDNGSRATDRYYSYIESNLLKGARIDAIGMQYHMFYDREEEYERTRVYYNPEKLYKMMDLYAGFGKPLQITEITVPAYSWEEDDEELQAEIIEKLYSIWFSHPAVEQIIYWNLVDGYAHLWNADLETIKASQGNMSLGENYYHGGLFRFDMTPKKSYTTIKDLIQKKWHSETEVRTGENGKASFKGFYGDYDLEISVEGKVLHKEIKLYSKGNNRFEIVI